MARLTGKTAIVTGGGGGIGSETARVLAAEGAAVVVADINAESGGAVVDGILADGGTASFCAFDAFRKESFVELAAHAVQTYGRIDLLHNNAAGTHLYGLDRDIVDIEPDSWDQIFELNTRGVLFGCQVVIPVMIKQGFGSIVNMSSTRADLGALDLAAYGASKSAVDAFSRYVATRYGKDGVRCNSIQPGFIETEQSKALHAEGDGFMKLMRHVCLPYPGSPRDIANMVLFLASDESRYVTGQMMRVDGGMLSHQPFIGDAR